MKSFFKHILVKILWWESRLILAKYKPKVVMITGSVGKTSTKDAVHAVLKRFVAVRKSKKSFNSEIGIPLTILGRENAWSDPILWIENILYGLFLIAFRHEYPKWLVLEVGAGKPGDISFVTKSIKADIVIFTRFAETPPHVEFFQSREHLFEEKARIVDALRKTGWCILNADDAEVMTVSEDAPDRTVSYGFSESATVRAGDLKVLYGEEEPVSPQGVVFSVAAGEAAPIPVIIRGGFGKNHVYAGLAALAVAHAGGFSLEIARDALESYELPAGRMRLIEGLKETFIIDDTYNSSPTACEAALSTLKELRGTGRKIAVLGDMLELGRFTEDAHKKIGEYAASCADILVTVGPRARLIAEGALNYGMNEENIFQYEESRKAGKFVEQVIRKGDAILVKGSQGMRMERVVEEIMANPGLKSLLLVRQEKEWLAKA